MINPFNDKFVLNFHHADFDGAISGTCVMAALGKNSICKAYSIAKVSDAVIEYIDDTDILLLTDIGIEHEKLNLLEPHMVNNKLIIYDHHLNDKTEETFSRFGDSSFSILDAEICGSTITWYKMCEYFPNNSKLKDLEEIVYLSDVYDMWRTNNKDFEYAAMLNNLLDYKIGYTPDTFRMRFLKNPDPYKLTKDEKLIIDRKKIKHDENLKLMERTASLFDFKDHVFVMVEADATDYTKMHFMNGVIEEECVDMFIFKYTNTTKCSVRIPPSSKIDDLNKWYDIIGCAGHKKAGGISGQNFYKLKNVLETV